MKAKTRRILFLSLIALFLIITPYLVLYSLGYRIDFKNIKIVATGGIYTRVQPSQVEVIINGDISNSTGIFSNSVFVQNLLPGQHSVLIKKDGYYDYQKNFVVKEKEVTKLENVILFNKNFGFEKIAGSTDQFLDLKAKPIERYIIVSGSLYYFDNAPENAQLSIMQRNTPLIKNVVSFKVSHNSIYWLGKDGILSKSNLEGKDTEKISTKAIAIKSKTLYSIEVFSQDIFLKEGANLLRLNDSSKSFESFYASVKDLKLSPDGHKLVYYNDNEIFLYFMQNLPIGEENNALLEKSLDKISEVYWLNNDYIIYNTTNSVVISEIDYRGNINKIFIEGNVLLANRESQGIEKPDIFYDQVNKTFYILTNKTLISSSNILP
ncbi:MAG: hypothetical protein FJZ43_00520 [Candidatus Staskawiczbacteria bacterium]|nr:hypothetical protein [Candidatus Staskawiczbacteria bacterium]